MTHPLTHEPSPPEGSKDDMLIVAMLKGMWTQYGHLPKVRAAFRLALADGQVAADELMGIQAAIAHALAQEMGGWEAFKATGPDPRMRAELEDAMERGSKHPEVATIISAILADGEINPEELALLRRTLADAMSMDYRSPVTRVRMPTPPRPNMPGRSPHTKDDEDEDRDS